MSVLAEVAGNVTAIGYGLAFASYAVGLALSALLDLPSSAVIVSDC